MAKGLKIVGKCAHSALAGCAVILVLTVGVEVGTTVFAVTGVFVMTRPRTLRAITCGLVAVSGHLVG